MEENPVIVPSKNERKQSNNNVEPKQFSLEDIN